LPFGADARSLSLTFDDGLDPTTNTEAHATNAQILAALKARRISAMVFPALSRIGASLGSR